MFRLLAATAIACLASGTAFAADCSFSTDLTTAAPRPESYMVAGPELLPFNADASTRLLHPGQTVVVTSTFGDLVCATIPGDAPGPGLISGLLPKAALLTVTLSPQPDWNGIWTFGADHQIVIKPASNGMIDLTGDAADNGQLDALIRPKKHGLAFTEANDANHTTLPYDPANGGCSAQFWLLDDYLVAVDNRNCGANASFTGIYQRASWPQ